MKLFLLIVILFSCNCSAGWAIEDHASIAAQQIEDGTILLNHDQLDRALALFRAAVKNDPKNSQAYEKLALALGLNGDLDAATKANEKAIQLDDKNASAHSQLAWTYGKQGLYRSSVTESKRAIELDPDDVSAHLTLGLALASLGDYQGAIAANQRAIELDPNNLKAYANLAATLGRMRNFADAAQIYTEAIRMNPNSAALRLGLGATLGKLGDSKGQIREFRAAVALAPNNAAAQGKLGWALYQAGDWKSAFKHSWAANTIRLGNAGPEYLQHLLSLWGGLFILFGLIFAVVFFSARFKPLTGETVIKSYFLIFYNEKPGHFVVTDKRLVFVPEWFSRWFGLNPVSIDRDQIKNIEVISAAKLGLVINTLDGGSYSFTMPALVLKPLSEVLNQQGLTRTGDA